MDSRIETQQGPAGIRGFLPSQVSTSLELSFVARDKIEKLKPGKGIRNDIPVTEAEGPGLEEMSKKQKKSSSERLILRQRQVGKRSHGATKVLQKPFRDQQAELIEGRRNTCKEDGRKLITHLQSKIKGTRLGSDV